MLTKLTLPKFIFIWLLTAFFIILNIYTLQSMTIGIIFGVIYLLFFGSFLGKILLPQQNLFWQIFYGLLFLISGISILGTIIYYFYQLNNLVISLIIIFVPLALLTLIKKVKQKNKKEIELLEDKKNSILIYILVTCYLLLVTACIYTLFKFQTTEAIRSPWWVVSKDFFLIYFLATLNLLTLLYYNRKTWLSLFLTVIHSFLTVSVALIVYKLGYGFDPFIHQATERAIFEKGIITPKPFYYLGQYSVVVILSKIFSISVDWLDKLLVPLMAALYLPLTIYFAFSNISLDQKRFFALLAPVIFIIPFSPFIVTTPQGLANIFTLLTIFFALIYVVRRQKVYLIPLMILALMTLFVHPLSGIPVLIFLFLLLFLIYIKYSEDWSEIFRIFIIAEIIILASIAIPLVFILNSTISNNLSSVVNTEIFTNPSLIFQTLKIPEIYFKNHFNLIYDLVYIYGFNTGWFLILIAILGLLIITLKYKVKPLLVYPLTFLILLINYLILKSLILFPSLIEYERINYPQRLLEISLYFLIPFFLYAIYQLIKKSTVGPMSLRVGVILLLTIFLTSSLYLSYPRDDDYHLDRGYNITQSDINAVRFIDNDAKTDFIVLANQITSVAAIKEFGFKKYYPALDGSARQYFYYPIPTGDPLYQYYLDMVYERPKKETAIAAMDLVGVNSAYFVVNKYWWKFDQVVEQAKQEADSWQVIDNGNIYVFRYSKTKTQN